MSAQYTVVVLFGTQLPQKHILTMGIERDSLCREYENEFTIEQLTEILGTTQK